MLDDNDKKLGPVEITERELAKLTNTICKYFIRNCINYQANNDKTMREIVETIGRESIVEKTVYRHTGLIRKDGKLRFLYHGGSIGISDNTEIETDLAPCNLEQYCFTDKEFDKDEALRTMYSLLGLADSKIMIPLMATVYLSPMYSLLEEADILINYVLSIIGKTGAFKSTIAALMLCHFGKFSITTFPLSFSRSTLAGIEKMAFPAKEICLVIDDYKPEKMQTDQEKIFEGILGLWGDRSPRIKMNAHGGLHKKYSPRGLAIITGERQPKFSPSRLARMITIHVQKGSIDEDKVKSIYYNKREQLAFGMKEYIKWIISNEQDIKDKARELQGVYSQKIADFKHPRIKQNIIVMLIGFTFWLDFMEENSIIDSTQKDELSCEAYYSLEEVGRNQENDVEDEDPIRIFFKTLSQLQIAGKVHLTDYKTGIATDLEEGTHIGYIDNETNQYYLIADTVYKEVEKACIGRFIVTPKQLQKSLADEGYIVTDRDNRKVLRRTDPKTKNKVEVLIIPKQKWNEAMLGNEETTS